LAKDLHEKIPLVTGQENMLAPYATPNLEGQGLSFIWSLPQALSGLALELSETCKFLHHSPGTVALCLTKEDEAE